MSLLSFFNANNFRVIIPEYDKVEFLTQKVTIPSMSLSVPRQATPFVPVPHAGTISYDDLVLSFKKDENIETWYSIYQWMNRMTSAEDYTKFDPFFAEIIIMSMDNQSNPTHEIKFTYAFPSFLSSIDLDVAAGAEPPTNATVHFEFVNMIL